MKRTLIILAIAAIAAPWSLVADEVLSRNAVGYVKQEFDKGDYYLVCVNFDTLSGGATVEDVFPADSTAFPSGTQISLWDPVAQTYGPSELLASFPPPIHWSPGTNELAPGTTFWLQIPGSAASDTYTNYTMGEVPSDETNTVDLAAGGYSFVSYSFPVATSITNAGLDSVVSSGDTVYFFKNGSWVAELWSTFPPPAHWSPGTNVIEPGSGLLIQAASATEWDQVKPYTWP